MGTPALRSVNKVAACCLNLSPCVPSFIYTCWSITPCTEYALNTIPWGICPFDYLQPYWKPHSSHSLLDSLSLFGKHWNIFCVKLQKIICRYSWYDIPQKYRTIYYMYSLSLSLILVPPSRLSKVILELLQFGYIFRWRPLKKYCYTLLITK